MSNDANNKVLAAAIRGVASNYYKHLEQEVDPVTQKYVAEEVIEQFRGQDPECVDLWEIEWHVAYEDSSYAIIGTVGYLLDTYMVEHSEDDFTKVLDVVMVNDKLRDDWIDGGYIIDDVWDVIVEVLPDHEQVVLDDD